MRQPILYADEMWKRQRFPVLFLLIAGLAVTAFLGVQYLRGVTHIDQSFVIWVLYIPAGLLLGGAFLVNRSRNHVRLGERITVSRLTRTHSLDYDLVRGVRVQPLRTAYTESGRKPAPMAKLLLDRPALYVRLRREDPRTPELLRALGSQLAFEDTVVLPIPDPDAAAWEINSRLPERTGVNMGGQRRRKRR